MGNRTKTVKDFLIMGFGIGLNMIFGIITTPIITRMVEPDHYGNLSLFIMYAEIGMMLFGMGLDQTLIRFFYHEENLSYRRKLLIHCYKAPFLICGLLFVFSILGILFDNIFAPFFNADIIILAIFILCVFFMLANRYSILLLRLQYKSVKYSVVNILQKAVYVGVAMVLLLLPRFNGVSDFTILALSTTFSFAVAFTIGVLLERKLWNPFNGKNYKLPFKTSELYKYGAPLILSSVVSRALHACGSSMLKIFCDDSTVGVYSSAMSLVSIFAIIQTTFNSIWAPMMVEHYEKDKEDKSFYKKGNQIITVILFLFGATVLVAKDLIVFLLGEKYRHAAFILPFLMFYPIMYTISETTNCGIVFMKKSHANIWVALISFLVDLIACFLLVPKFGAIGAAIATALAYIVFYLARTIIANMYFKIETQMKKLMVICSLFFLLCLYGSFNSFNIVLLMAYIVFCIILSVLYKGVIFELINIVKELLNKKSKKALIIDD